MRKVQARHYNGGVINIRTKLRFSVLVLLLSSVQNWPQSAATAAKPLVAEERGIAPGLVYRHLLDKTPAGEPWSIHVLEVSRKAGTVRIRAVAGRNPAPPEEMQRELPTQIAVGEAIRGKRVVAVVNGDYDALPYLGVSVGPSVTSGRVWTAGGKSAWPAFGMKSGTPAIGTPVFSADLRWGKQRVEIDTYNKPLAVAKNVAMYSREFRSSLRLGKAARVVHLRPVNSVLPAHLGSIVRATVSDNQISEGAVEIGEGELVVVVTDPNSAASAKLAGIERGQVVEIDTRLQVGILRNPDEAIGGFPIVVHNGRREVIGKPSESHSKRHPRTAVCYNSQSVIFAVVDGRQPALSVGMTLDELGDLMVSLGCTEAMNTDGGGSSVMATVDAANPLQMRIVNSPSDSKERGRGNAWVIEATGEQTVP